MNSFCLKITGKSSWDGCGLGWEGLARWNGITQIHLLPKVWVV